jgi:hypothetical protein
VGVIPARSRGVGRGEGVAQASAGGNHGRAFLHGTVVVRVGGQPVPMDDVFAVGVVGHVDGYRHSLAQAQDRARDLAVVGECLDVHARRNLQAARLDAEGVVCLGLRRLRGGGGFLCSTLLGCIEQARWRGHKRVQQRMGHHAAGGKKKRSTVH